MKIIILGTLRTRSSYLLSALCNNYNLENKWEFYDDFFREVTNAGMRKDPDFTWPLYKEKVIELTDNLKKQDNFVIKVFSHAFFNSNRMEWNLYRNKPFVLDQNDMLDFHTHFDIEIYDRIYFLNRKDYVSNVCSYLFGTSTKLLYLDATRDKSAIKYFNRPRILHYDKLSLQLMVIKHMLMEVFEQRLLETKLPYTKLDYDDVPAYVSNTYPNITSDFIETKFDYKTLIKNYDQIVNVIEEEKLKFQPIVENLLSK